MRRHIAFDRIMVLAAILLICVSIPLTVTAQGGVIDPSEDIVLMDEEDGLINIPDANLRAASEQYPNRHYARSFAANLNRVVNSNGLVRLVYFVPSDRRPRPNRVEALRQLIKDAQQFFADEMDRHGFGRKTFTVETDTTGTAVVHQIDGRFSNDYYYTGTSDFKVWSELLEHFDGDDLQHVYFVAIDLSYQALNDGQSAGLGGPIFYPTYGDIGFGPAGGAKLRHRDITPGEELLGGFALIPAHGHNFERLGLTVHELGHGFGIEHDFREGIHGDYVMAFGRSNRLSKCAAEWLSVSRFFNTKSRFDNEPGTVQLLSLQPHNQDIISFRFEVTDPDGLHQAQLLVPTILENPEWAGWGAYRLFDCKRLNGTTGIVESVVRTAELVDRIALQIVDLGGNISWATFSLQLDETVPVQNALDINSDGRVDILDLTLFVSRFGQREQDPADVNENGVVDVVDVLLVTAGLSDVPQQAGEMFTPADVQQWLTHAKQLEVENVILKEGVMRLERLLAVLTAVTVDIPDPNLRAVVENTLGKASGATITTADMANLTRLEAKNANISDLTGLESATNLTQLYLHAEWDQEQGWINSNSVSDLSPLAELTNLEWLLLQNNLVSDLSPLAGLTNLTWLRLQNNLVSDLSPLVGLTNLEELNFSGNGISDLSPLAGLTNLDSLNFEHNSISDISPLAGLTNLTFLDLDGNPISDISAVAGLTNLTFLDIWGTSISDISPVMGLTNLRTLGLGFNNISDISPVAGLTNLIVLYLPSNRITDISSLSGLTQLKDLNLPHNNISDLSPLVANTGLESGDMVDVRGNPLNRVSIETHIPDLLSRGVAVAFDNVIAELVDIPDANLRAVVENALGKASGAPITTVDMAELPELYARNADISNLAGLEFATNLTRLDLGTEYVESENRSINSNSVSDLSPLSGLTNLTWLRLRNNSISDISPLSGLTNLEWLNLGGNLMISDLSVLSGLTNLTSLYLYGNSISDISPLAGLTNLTFLNLWFNSISDISSLAGLTNLTWLAVDNNLISDISPLTGLTNLGLLGLSNHPTFFPATGLTHLTSININNNTISDLSPLVANTGLGPGDLVEVWGNPLSDASIQTHISALQSRGVTVEFIQIPTFLLKISGTVTVSDNLLIVEVRDNRNRPLAGFSVTFTIISGGGTLSVTNATTGPNGRAESRLTLGLDIGTNRVRASVEGISESVTFSDVPEPPVDIPDSNLRAAIESELDKPSGDIITASDMARLRRLTARNANISNLTGLEAATNLTNLDLGGEWVEGSGRINSNSISDLSPLSGLTNLSNLILDRNSITDLSPLLGLTKLEWLLLSNNSITDLSPLSELTNLGSLVLQNNNLSDLSPLAELTNLANLSLSGNSISDISILSELPRLELLGLSNNNISDLSPLAGLTNLRELSIGANTVTTISPLSGLTNLIWLLFDNNSVSDISAVVGLTNLTFLNLGGNSVSDISSVVGLTNLEFLILEDNLISDISAVAGLTNLTFLFLADNSIVDLSPLVENTGLGEGDWIDVERNPLSFPSIYTHIPALRSRGVGVGFQPPEPDLLSGHTDAVVSVAFSRDGTLASGGRDGTVILWDAVTEQPIATLMGHIASARSVAFSPDGSILASGSYDRTIILWDVATQQPKDMLTEHTAGVESIAFSWDGSILASGSHNGTIILWDPVTGQPIDTIMGQANRVWSLAFSPDGTLAIGRDDGTILLWDVATRRPKYTLIGGHTAFVESVTFNRDGSTLASGSGDNTVILWEVATGRPIAILPGHTGGVNSVAFSPDGTILASGSDDSTVRLWDAVTGQPIATLTGHTGFVRSVAFSPDGTTLASGSGDSTVRLWEVAPPPLEFLLSIPKDLNLIHVPLKVTAVGGKAETIESVSDLYDALGGAPKVGFLVTYDSQTQTFSGYFGPSDKGTAVDKELADDTGILANMIARTEVRLRGTPLGTNGTSTITLNPGFNVVGLPLRDSRINRVSDLLDLDGISGNVQGIILTDGGDFQLVTQPGDPSNIPIVGGQAFMLYAQQAETVTISGEGWVNVSGVNAAPPVTLKGIEVRDTTPVLGLKGLIVDEEMGLNQGGFRVTVKNLSTGKAATTVTGHDETGYRHIIVDIETKRAAMIGDILEISARSSNPFIGVEPLRYAVTAEDVKRSLIQVPELVTYEIPAETELLSNYPNPFNPETWIPYRLAEDAFVTLTIYDLSGQVVRTLDVGHQVAAVYENRSKAAYWDGRNNVGELVASGVYFYHLSAGDYAATRKMVILK